MVAGFQDDLDPEDQSPFTTTAPVTAQDIDLSTDEDTDLVIKPVMTMPMKQQEQREKDKASSRNTTSAQSNSTGNVPRRLSDSSRAGSESKSSSQSPTEVDWSLGMTNGTLNVKDRKAKTSFAETSPTQESMLLGANHDHVSLSDSDKADSHGDEEEESNVVVMQDIEDISDDDSNNRSRTVSAASGASAAEITQVMVVTTTFCCRISDPLTTSTMLPFTI